MKKRNRDTAQFSMSFMDIICCGFGAIILLLVITKTEKSTITEAVASATTVLSLEQQLESMESEIEKLQTQLQLRRQAIELAKQPLARIQEILAEANLDLQQAGEQLQISMAEEKRTSKISAQIATKLERLPTLKSGKAKEAIAGIPLDGEYIIFIIDTSGSMRAYAWSLMLETLEQILNVYPKVRGLQVLNDMGTHLFSKYRGKWIPDTPGRRRVVLKNLANWDAFSNSSPVEGIQEAISTYYDGRSNIAIYVLGDEFSGQSIANVLDTVDKLNGGHTGNQSPVRIHAIGFPVQFAHNSANPITGIRFATLMRELTNRNEGAFIGLPNTR